VDAVFLPKTVGKRRRVGGGKKTQDATNSVIGHTALSATDVGVLERQGRNPNLEKETWRTAPSRFRPRHIQGTLVLETSRGLLNRLLAVVSTTV